MNGTLKTSPSSSGSLKTGVFSKHNVRVLRLPDWCTGYMMHQAHVRLSDLVVSPQGL